MSPLREFVPSEFTRPAATVVAGWEAPGERAVGASPVGRSRGATSDLNVFERETIEQIMRDSGGNKSLARQTAWADPHAPLRAAP
jgi:hypothetical protein